MPPEERDVELGAGLDEHEVPGSPVPPSAAEVLAPEPTEPGTVKHVLSSLIAVETAAPQEASKDVHGKDDKIKPKEKTANEENKQAKQADEKLKPEVPSLMHGKFSTDGRFQEFVYVPTSDYADVNSKSTELFDTILRHWNMQRPQLLIKFQ